MMHSLAWYLHGRSFVSVRVIPCVHLYVSFYVKISTILLGESDANYISEFTKLKTRQNGVGVRPLILRKLFKGKSWLCE